MPSNPVQTSISSTGGYRLSADRDWVTPAAPTRILAWLMDAVASVVITVSLYRVTWILCSRLLGPDAILTKTLVLSSWFMGFMGYWLVMPAATGAMPGMMFFRLRFVSITPRSLSLTQVILREAAGQVVTAVSLGLGFISGLSDPRGRGLADRIAGTMVVQFTEKRPEVYGVQDLQFETEGDDLVSDQLTSEASVTGSSLEASAVPVETPATAAGPLERASASTSIERGAPSTLYARPAGESAFERRQRSAQGMGVPELARALRNTAELVAGGTLMQKVLDRKLQEFIEAMHVAPLGDRPRAAVNAVIALSKEGLLGREDLQKVHEILKSRLKKAGTPAPD